MATDLSVKLGGLWASVGRGRGTLALPTPPCIYPPMYTLGIHHPVYASLHTLGIHHPARYTLQHRRHTGAAAPVHRSRALGSDQEKRLGERELLRSEAQKCLGSYAGCAQNARVSRAHPDERLDSERVTQGRRPL